MTTPAEQDDHRRRGLVVLLLGAVLLLLLGLLGGYLAFGRDEAVGAGRLPSATGSTSPRVVPAGGQPAARPSVEPVIFEGTSQPVSRPSVTDTGLPLLVTSRVVGRLAPGQPATLVLTVTNPGPTSVVVTSVSARVTSLTAGSSGGSPCSPTWYDVTPFTGSRALAPGASGELELLVTFQDLPTVNQDGCKGARYSYAYRVEARQA